MGVARDVYRVIEMAVVALSITCSCPQTARAESVGDPTHEDAAGAESPKDKEHESGWVGLPAISYAPETSLALGAFVLYHFPIDPVSYASSVSLLGMGTFKRQAIVELTPEFYWSKNQNRVEAYFEGQKFPDRFYGTGNGVRERDAEGYDRRFVRSRLAFRRHVVSSLYAGLSTDQLWMKVTEVRAGGLFETREYVGEGGGFTSGIGVNALWDTRDDRTYATSGQMLDLLFIPYLRAFGSDFEFSRFRGDLRSFWSTWARQVIGFRYIFELTHGDTPFYLLPYLGGPNVLRGYFAGKYRDAGIQVLEAEYRLHLVWRLGAVLFAGAGQIGPNAGEMVKAPLRPSLGGGLRFDMSGGENINVRVDAGWGPGTFGLYVTMLEIF